MLEQGLEGFRLSPQQQRLWYSQDAGAVHLAQCTVLVEGPLRPDILQRAIRTVVDRHEILRTRYVRSAGIKLPFQVVADSAEPAWDTDDWTRSTPSQQTADINRLLEEHRRLGRDLESRPFLRFGLIRLTQYSHALVVSLPGLSADSLTLDNLLREIADSYGACAANREQDRSVLQYADYCAWLEEIAAAGDDDARRGLAHWQAQNGPREALVLPFQFPGRGSDPGDVGRISADLGVRPESVDLAAAQETASTADFLLACFQTVIGRFTPGRDVVTALRLACRGQEELHDAFGVFARWAPIHSTVPDDAPFRTVLASAHAAARDAERWQDYFAGNEELLEPAIGFEYEDRPQPAYTAAGVSLSLIEKSVPAGRFILRLSCSRTPDGLVAIWYHDPQLVVRDDVERLAEHFRAAVQHAVQPGETIAGRLDVLTARQRDQLLVGFNTPGVQTHDAGAPECIHERFQQQAQRTPDNVALVCEERRFTYRELEARASQLARYLASRDVGPDTPAAIYIGRSADMVVALLGVLEAGGAYVALDYPGLPAARLQTILNEVRPRVVLTLSALRGELPDHESPVVCLDADWPLISADRGIGSARPRPTGANLAYVLFTSGSTGSPKGVAVEHRQLAGYVDSISQLLDLPSNASYACVSTFAADLGNTVVFPALCSGGTLHVVSQDRATDAEAFAAYISDHSIDCLKIVPSHLQALLTAPRPERALPKRRLVLGGEAADWNLIRQVQELAQTCIVLNHYGPTETTVGASTYQVTAEAFDQRTASVPIGRPVATATMHVLGPDFEPVPIWAPGEIYIGGAGLARGYLNRPDLTAQRFIPNPFKAGQRMYRTGDLGRYLPDGCIEFLGRTDDQVKIRGFRVELGEIAGILSQHPDVRQAIVLLREDVPGGQQLAAYVAAGGSRSPGADELRGVLRSRLPEHMVPSVFFVLDALPLTANGKVDRARLLQLRPAAAGGDTAPPRAATPLESTLSSIFAEVLRTPTVNVDSNFFELGGHSLLALQVLSRIRRELNVDLPVRVLFENPTVAGVAAAVAAGSSTASVPASAFEDGRPEPRRQEALRIPAREAGNPVPLSSTQEQMWFVNQLSPGSPSYNMASAFRITGRLNVTALERSFNEIVRRHESLRTTIESRDGVPVQVIAPTLTMTLPVVAISGESAGPSEEAIRLAAKHAREPFDLATGPLLRCRLLKVGDEEHLLLIAVHHIVSDGWSWSVLFAELSTLYAAFSEQRPSPLPELPVQYGDFVRWNVERLRGGVLDQRLAYWKRQLADVPPLLDLPTDRPPAAIQSSDGAIHTVMFPLALKEQLEALSRAEGATLFMTLCAAFNALLFRWTGQHDIVVGSTIAGRNRPELEPLIGLFINTLVLRTDLSGNPAFRELLRRFRDVALGAYANQEVPFDRIIEGLHSTRSLSHGTLFQVVFAVHHGTSQQDLALAGLAVERVPVEMGAVKFPLAVSITDKPDGLRCAVTYQTALFDAATIQRMVAQFQRLLSGVAHDPGLRLSELPLMSEAERHRMLVTWNDTRRDYPTDACIHELFERQVARTPDACAIAFEDATLSYRQLDRQSSAVAGRLREAGVRRGACIVICIDRGLDMPVGLFAVLKAGCAYVPLDPQYSLERLAWVLEDTGASVLLTGRRLAKALANAGDKLKAVTVICLDDEVPAANRHPVRSPVADVSVDDLAYVVYTSGSTGAPKGVEISHRSLVNFALASAESFALRAADRVLQFAALSFDTAAEEIFPCLITGATLVLRTDRMIDSAPGFLDQCRRWRITVLDLPTIYWHELTEHVAAGSLELPETLRLVILGGDRALPERAEQWQRAARGRVRLLNEYGPTETTVVALTHEVKGVGEASQIAELREVPIGKPIANVQSYILDRELNPVPIGVRGQLYIGGTGLARGYRRRPDLTAQAFVPDPFSQTPGARLYKTGDLARYLEDGSVEFLGRTDHQVKVRGFRVEPGEIEAVLMQQAAVRHVVVVPRKEQAGDHTLVAYVVAASGVQLSAQALRDFLKGRLPPYMVPSAFVLLDALPLTAHGKVDRRALPAPGPDPREGQDTFVAARTPLEQQLVEEWQALLPDRRIGSRDNFFELGGHSLLAVRLIARIEKRLGRAVSVAVLFESPTIEQLAVHLQRHSASESWSSLIAVQPNGSRPPLFWVHGDQSVAILPAYLGRDQPLYGLEHQSQDGRPARYTRVEEIAAHYLHEVRSVRSRGPYLLGGYSFGAVVAFEMAQQLRRAGEHVDLLFLLDPSGKVVVANAVSVPDQVRHHLRSVPDQIRHHLRRMAARSPSDRWRYVWQRMPAGFYRFVGQVDRIKRLRIRVCLLMHRPLPPSLRGRYILGVYARALRHYVPQQYPGPVILVRAEGASYRRRLDWIELITNRPRILQLKGKHLDLPIEPQVGAWAGWLTESLAAAAQRRRPRLDSR